MSFSWIRLCSIRVNLEGADCNVPLERTNLQRLLPAIPGLMSDSGQHHPSDVDELEEVVVGQPGSAKKARRSREEARSPFYRRYPKISKQGDPHDNRPLLQHANSEPQSRLQVVPWASTSIAKPPAVGPPHTLAGVM